MTFKNIGAHTSCTSPYPEYISVNITTEGFVNITVRSLVNSDGTEGDSATIALTKEKFTEIFKQALTLL